MLLSTELTHAILRKVSGRDRMFGRRRRTAHLRMGFVRRRSREEALAYIARWIRENAGDQIVYCDAYFSTKDIQLLRMCLAQAPQSQIKIIASKPHLLKVRNWGRVVRGCPARAK